ncbi:hypothetical protein AB0G85_33090 [Streptomyces sioyaensis]|uniref:hypothetical protein n=1 Tax=Streptomyces sioyaensis TaxID=67364 RepID=UPI0033CC3749
MTRNYDEQLTVERPGTAQESANGPTAYWQDGTTTYVLHFAGGHISWTVADEADTALGALEAIREGEEIDKYRLQTYIRDVRRLEMRMTALKEELMLYAREEGPDGEPRLSWGELGDELRQHRTTAAERHRRILAGDTAAWRNWLTQHTERARLYTNGGELPVEEQELPEHKTDVYDVPDKQGMVQARCRCGWSSTAVRNVLDAANRGKDHEGNPQS